MHQGGIENKETHRLGCLEGTGQWVYGEWAESINHPYNSFLTYVEIYEARNKWSKILTCDLWNLGRSNTDGIGLLDEHRSYRNQTGERLVGRKAEGETERNLGGGGQMLSPESFGSHPV
jgi:hypothetical protein